MKMVKANVSLPNVSLCFIYDRARRQVTEKSLFLYLEDGSLITAMRTTYRTQDGYGVCFRMFKSL